MFLEGAFYIRIYMYAHSLGSFIEGVPVLCTMPWQEAGHLLSELSEGAEDFLSHVCFLCVFGRGRGGGTLNLDWRGVF